VVWSSSGRAALVVSFRWCGALLWPVRCQQGWGGGDLIGWLALAQVSGDISSKVFAGPLSDPVPSSPSLLLKGHS
jgi:hypothetical protein